MGVATHLMTTGALVSNTYATCPLPGNNPGKLGLMPHNTPSRMGMALKAPAAGDGHAQH